MTQDASSAPANDAVIVKSALWSLGLSLCFPFLFVFVSIPAIVLGRRALRKIRNSNGMLLGRGIATAGIIIGWIGTIWFVVGVLLAILLPAFVQTS